MLEDATIDITLDAEGLPVRFPDSHGDTHRLWFKTTGRGKVYRKWEPVDQERDPKFFSAMTQQGLHPTKFTKSEKKKRAEPESEPGDTDTSEEEPRTRTRLQASGPPPLESPKPSEQKSAEEEPSEERRRSALRFREPSPHYPDMDDPDVVDQLPIHRHRELRLAVGARNVRPDVRMREDRSVTDLVQAFTNTHVFSDPGSRVHLVAPTSAVSNHFMLDMQEDSNMGRRRAMAAHQKTGPYAGRKGRSRVMHSSANVQARTRNGTLFETTIGRNASAHELQLVIAKLRVHLKSNVGSLLTLHYGNSKVSLGDLKKIKLKGLLKKLQALLRKHGKVGIEVLDAKKGGALHRPRMHEASFARTLV